MFQTDVSSGGSTAYMPAAAMKSYPVSDAGFTSLQLDSKVRYMLLYIVGTNKLVHNNVSV